MGARVSTIYQLTTTGNIKRETPVSLYWNSSTYNTGGVNFAYGIVYEYTSAPGILSSIAPNTFATTNAYTACAIQTSSTVAVTIRANLVFASAGTYKVAEVLTAATATVYMQATGFSADLPM